MYRRDPSGIPLVEAGGTFNIQQREQSGLFVATSVLREAQPIRSEKFVITLPGDDDRVKALQIIWQRGELGVFVGTPYFSPLHALVGRMIVPPGPDGPVTISLRENAKVSREKVKMSFHQSGNVRFSATRRIEPIQTNISPLADKVGHLFTLHVRGSGALQRVAIADRVKRPEKEWLIDFPIELSEGDAVKMVGRWYPQSMVIATRPDLDRHGPPGLAHLQVREGALEDGMLIAPPTGWPWGGYCLFLTVSRFDDPGGLQEPYALLRGGFGPYSEPGSTGAGTSFLGAMYTNRESEIDDLTRQLGSVDLSGMTA